MRRRLTKTEVDITVEPGEMLWTLDWTSVLKGVSIPYASLCTGALSFEVPKLWLEC